ncbi:hypothetical protein Q3V30_16150 [Erwinia pyri]|uniref:Uncharacterized protein n=1 Tax=Erwinia pyri TaxID=3062598 RepID=A0AA50DL17_9GAMM|nr:hypothetical protein [Erwinia sp. DE2]WLS77985.1 hypothetical protein Q3V30_16150 [Erwinia sp. DE2]
MRKSIPIPDTVKEPDLNLLSENIQRIIPKIEASLTGSLLWYSQNAQYVPDSMKIISIEHSGESRYKMRYSFRWNVFNGCLDIDEDETTTETVNFEYQPGQLIFDFIQTEQSTSADEL